MQLNALAIFIFLLAHYSATINPFIPNQDYSFDDPVNLAIERLWTSDEKLRKKAKRDLIRLGSSSIRPLLTLLEDINTNPQPRFEKGKELEGWEYIERYNSLPRDKQDFDEYDRIDISKRLKGDAIELLGKLKAQEAIPILIAMLRERIYISPKDIVYPESKALIEIGAISVPELVDAMERAEKKAGDRQESIMCSRIAFVLGEIGDARGLPILEEIQKGSKVMFLDYIEDAIEKLKEKSKAQY
jgi:HEAT repeat protein